MKHRRQVAWFVVMLAILVLQACSGGGSSAPAGSTVGAVQMSLTDAPGDFDHVWITVREVRFHTSPTADPRSGSWLRYPLAAPVTLDLLNLANGSMEPLWNNMLLPVGMYQQIRLMLEPTYPTVLNPAPAGHTFWNEVVSSQTGSTMPLFVPDAGHGIKLVGRFMVKPGSTLRLAVDFDAGHDIVELHAGQDFILKPRLKYYDLDEAGAIVGTLSTGGTFTNTARFVIKAERLATAQEMLESGGTGTYHVVRRWTVPRPDGSFILYPVSTRITGTWDIVIRGLNTQTMIIKDVPVTKGSTPGSGATDLGTITTSPAAADYAIDGTIQSPTGAWVQFYQTLPGGYPYEIRFRHFNPLLGAFSNFMLNNDQIQVGSFASSGSTIAFAPVSPAEGVGNYRAAADAVLYTRGTASALVNSSTGTVSFTALPVTPPYQANTVSGSVVLQNMGMMQNRMNSGLLFAVQGGMIVNAIDGGSSMGMGGSYSISLPGGSPSTPLPGAFYGIDAVGWQAPLPSPYKAIAIPQIVDLRMGNDTATMDMIPLW